MKVFGEAKTTTGVEGLIPPGSCCTWSPEQEKELQKAIYDKSSDRMKPPFTLWTRIAIQQLIRRTWSVDMSVRTVGE